MVYEEIEVGDIITCETYCSIGERLIFFKKDFKVTSLYKTSKKVDMECLDTGVEYRNIDLSKGAKGCIIGLIKNN